VSDRPGEMAETLVADGRPLLADRLLAEEDTQEGAPLASGTVLAHRWELLGLLGVGGMGSVYRARDRELDEVVAVKVLRCELARSTSMIERFRREVKLARRVTHPNVARTFDIGEDGDLRFLTMELLDGRPLSNLLARASPSSASPRSASGSAPGSRRPTPPT
jgi:eukaryotic-like serine/threonine-protein kinase